MVRCFLISLSSASIVNFRSQTHIDLINVWVFCCCRWYSIVPFFHVRQYYCKLVMQYPQKVFVLSCPFFVKVKRFLRAVTCFNSAIIFTNLSVSLFLFWFRSFFEFTLSPVLEYTNFLEVSSLFAVMTG